MVINLLQADTMKFSILSRCLHPVTQVNPSDPDICGVVYDSRQVRKGSCYVALPGLHVDGNDFIDQAIAAGAVAIISEQPPRRRDVSWAQVNHAREALSAAAASFYGFPSTRLSVMGVTGTNGKTTTAYMVQHIQEICGRSTGLIGTIEYRIGSRVIPATRTTPEAPDLHAMLDQMSKAGCSHAVMEVSSHSIDQKRGADIDFDQLLFTNLSQDHLDYHGDMETYFQTKQKLFVDQFDRRQQDVGMTVCVEDSWGRRLYDDLSSRGARIQSVGLKETSDVYASSIVFQDFACTAVVHAHGERADLLLPIMGEHNLLNALGAIAVCLHGGIPLQDAVSALSSLPGVPGRLERFHHDGVDVVVDYAHTPDALESVMKLLKEQSSGRLISVFGCGGDRDRGKRSLMGGISSTWADETILTHDNPRSEDPSQILDDIILGMSDGHAYRIIEDRFDAIQSAMEMAEPGDVVLLAGKGHERSQEIGKTIFPFSDRESVMALMMKDAQ